MQSFIMDFQWVQRQIMQSDEYAHFINYEKIYIIFSLILFTFVM